MERRNRMQLHVENFAKIKEADIEIEGITVIAGENNTGKSTIGKLLYCFFNVFYNYEDRLYKQKVSALKERINNSIKVTQIISSQGRIVRKLGNFNKDLLDKFVDLFISHYHMDISLKEYADVCQAFFQSNENYHIEVDDYDVFIKQIFLFYQLKKIRKLIN
ncbi:AAA family ATPase [Allocoprobacillus halotolerans]|uniref:AAA family ATPase n=1 Tax=Allocoprobacillus halotolerans TaxID=2944914 RepID=A0ABY5I1X5_9FIRM|nr:AAA family ATPase [Allocoprobacillus halotolerans]UTY37997.1 AAA family ATPase [Allocoprobacillus halotolerans]